MKVRMYGFAVEADLKAISVDDVMAHFAARSGAPDHSRNIERRIFVNANSHDGYYVGLVVTVKDQRRFCRLEDDKGQIRITVENLLGDDKLMEFNFFVLNKKNGLGLYQHYHQSCGLNVFGHYLTSCYKQLREEAARNDIEEEKRRNGDITKSGEASVRKRYRGRLHFSQLVKKDDLEKILREYKSLKAFEYELSALDVINRPGVPLLGYVRKLKEKLTFERSWSVHELASAIARAVDEIKPKNGRIYARNEFNEDISVRIFDIPDDFGEEEFDDVALKLHDLDLNEFAKHKVPKELIALCKSDDLAHIFEARLE